MKHIGSNLIKSVICVTCQKTDKVLSKPVSGIDEKEPDANPMSLHQFILAGSGTSERTFSLGLVQQKLEAWQSSTRQHTVQWVLPGAGGIEI